MALRSTGSFSIYALATIIVLLVASAGIYLFSEHRTGSSGDALIDAKQRLLNSADKGELSRRLASAKSDLALATENLDALKRRVLAHGRVIESGYEDALSTVQVLDVLFNAPTSKKPTYKLKADVSKKAFIDIERAGVTRALEAWKAIVDSIGPGGPTPEDAAKAAEYADAIQHYFEDIVDLLDESAPAGGITQTVIDNLLKKVEDAVGTTDTVVDILDSIGNIPPLGDVGGSASGSGSEATTTDTGTGTSVPPTLDGIRDALDAGQGQVDTGTHAVQDIQNTIDGVPPTSYVPPPGSYGSSPYTWGTRLPYGGGSMGSGDMYAGPGYERSASDGPQLIEGSNNLDN